VTKDVSIFPFDFSFFFFGKEYTKENTTRVQTLQEYRVTNSRDKKKEKKKIDKITQRLLATDRD
jgi:uncharacterized protein YjcR